MPIPGTLSATATDWRPGGLWNRLFARRSGRYQNRAGHPLPRSIVEYAVKAGSRLLMGSPLDQGETTHPVKPDGRKHPADVGRVAGHEVRSAPSASPDGRLRGRPYQAAALPAASRLKSHFVRITSQQHFYSLRPVDRHNRLAQALYRVEVEQASSISRWKKARQHASQESGAERPNCPNY